MHTVYNILQSKKSKVFAVSSTTKVFEALEQMVDKNVSALLVIDENKLVGIISERDYARKVILKGKSSKDTTVSEIMTSDLVTVSPNTTIDECMHIMTDNHIRHLPVMENETVTGIISIGDVVKSIIDDQKFIIDNMANYIAGS